MRSLSYRCHGSAVARHKKGVAALFELLEQGILNIILRIDEGGVYITLCAELRTDSEVVFLSVGIRTFSNCTHRSVGTACRQGDVCQRVERLHRIHQTVIHILHRTDIDICRRTHRERITTGLYSLRRSEGIYCIVLIDIFALNGETYCLDGIDIRLHADKRTTTETGKRTHRIRSACTVSD